MSKNININLVDDMNEAYYPMLTEDARYLLFMGGAGAGKSHAIAQKIIYRCLSDNIPHRFLILRKTNRSVAQSCYALLRYWLQHWGIPHKAIRNNIKFLGHELIFSGFDDPEKIKSIEGITSIWLEEATEFSYADFKQLDLRLRGDTGSYKQIIFSFNPLSKHSWLYKNFYERETEGAVCGHYLHTDNRFLDLDYTKKLLAETDEVYSAIYTRGEWIDTPHAIYADYVIKGFDIKALKERAKKRYYCLDFGWNDPSVCLEVVEYDQAVYVCGEIFVRHNTNKDFLKLIKKTFRDAERFTFYADSAEPDRIYEFNQEGFDCRKANKSIKDGIDEVRSRTVIIHESCVNTGNEISMYSYKTDKDGVVYDTPIDYNNHCMDSLRYGVFTSKSNEGIQLFI